MAKRPTLEDRLAELEALRAEPNAEATAAALRHALGLKNSFIVARAAELTGEFELGALSDAMVSAFGRLIDTGYEADKGCRAKTAVVDAFQKMNAGEDRVFLRGVAHVQMEPVYGGRVDTAGGLRNASAIGLVRMNHPHSLLVLADLLADPIASVRTDAARTLAFRGAADGVPLMRIRVRVGDEDPNVLTECLYAMLQLDAGPSLEFVDKVFNGPDPTLAESAALALGQSRLPEGFDKLMHWLNQSEDRDQRKTLLLAMAMLRQDTATAYLIAKIEQGRYDDACDAVDALGIYRHDDAVCSCVLEAAKSHEDEDLLAYAHGVFK
jgi:HEAT repeat protein